MRKLETHDVFMALRVINAVGVKEEVANIYELTKNNKGKKLKIEDVGMEFILNILSKAGTSHAEMAIYDFLSGPLELTSEDIKKMDPLELLEKVQELVEYVDVERWKAFFKSVAAMMKKLNS